MEKAASSYRFNAFCLLITSMTFVNGNQYMRLNLLENCNMVAEGVYLVPAMIHLSELLFCLLILNYLALKL